MALWKSKKRFWIGIIVLAILLGIYIFWMPQNQGDSFGKHVHTTLINSNGDIFLGSHDGLYRSSTQGHRWEQVRSVPKTDVMALTRNPQNLQQLYLAGHDVGVMKSVDGGTTWSQVFEGAVSGISIDPENPSVVYIATIGKVFKSDNGGVSWSESQILGLTQAIVAVKLDPRTPNNLLAVSMDGVLYKSVDQGASWQRLN